MARRGNYGAEKRQKELKRKKKQQEKAERKRLKALGDVPEELEPGAEGEAEAATEESPEPEAEGAVAADETKAGDKADS